jgi:hypothetical protein
MRTLILGWLGLAAMGCVNRKSSRAIRPNAAATLVLPVDGISDSFPLARSGFQHDHDGKLLLKTEYRDARGLPANVLSRIRQEVLQFLDGFSVKCQQDITGQEAGFCRIACVRYFHQDHARFTWSPCGRRRRIEADRTVLSETPR